VYFEDNADDAVTYANKHAKGTVKNVSAYSVQNLRTTDYYTSGEFQFRTNGTHITFVPSCCTGESKTEDLDIPPTTQFFPYCWLYAISGNPAATPATAQMKNITVRKNYDTNPTVTVLGESDDMILVKIENVNTFEIQNFQFDVDPDFIASEGDSLRVIEYSRAPVPYPTYPENGEVLTFEYPPVANEINFTWSTPAPGDLTTGIYEYEVRTIGGTLIQEGTTTNFYKTLSLAEGSYVFYIKEQGTVHGFLESSFTIANTYITGNATAIVGTVYEMQNNIKTPVQDAVVYIYNDTWTNIQTVGSDGYFSFVGLAGDETYYLKGNAELFEVSEINIVNTTTNATMVSDILLVRVTNEYMPHYVEYTLQTLFGTKYTGITADVYKGSSIGAVPYRTGVTGADGSVTFRLDQNQQYTLYFYGTGVNETITHYPKDEKYTVYITEGFFEDPEFDINEISMSVSNSIINDTHAYINFSYNDSYADTDSLKVYLNTSEDDKWINQTELSNYTGSDDSKTYSFIVEDYTGRDYIVHFVVEHGDLGDLERSFAVKFFGMENAHGFDKIYPWIALFSLIFVGGLFKANNAAAGSMVVCGVGWVFLALGWFDPLGEGMSTAISIAMGLATSISIVAVLAKGRKEG